MKDPHSLSVYQHLINWILGVVLLGDLKLFFVVVVVTLMQSFKVPMFGIELKESFSFC